ncbi:MAG: recombinase RecT [Lutibacter sp.]|nr:recombinase RecT [Lutibacter sp.]
MKNLTTNTNTNVANYSELEGMINLSRLMATSKVTIPVHLRNEGDCLAIVMQSAQWGMNPFSVAQKTFLLNGVLGYEAQLVAAIINKNAPIKERLNYQFVGNWDKVIGNTKEKTSKNGNVYRVSASTPEDEKGCGVIVSATMHGETKPRELHLMLTQVTVRNSTLWAEDPKQQLSYLASKKWSRLFCPDVILGVYTKDEVEEIVGNVTIEETFENETVHNEKPIQTVQIESKPTIQTKQIEVPNEKQKPSAALQLFTFIKSKGITDSKMIGNFVTNELKLSKENIDGINNTLSDLPELEKTIVKFTSSSYYKLFTFIKSKGINDYEKINSFINDMLGVTKFDEEEIIEILNQPDSLNSLINEFKQLEGIEDFNFEESNIFNH